MNEQEDTTHSPQEGTTSYPVDHTLPASPYDPYARSEPHTTGSHVYPYPEYEIGVPPPPPQTDIPSLSPNVQEHSRRGLIIIGAVVLTALLLFASAGMFYLARTTTTVQKTQTVVRVVQATPTTSDATQVAPTPTPVIETPTPTAMIVPYTASDIYQDFQAAGIAMSNVHSDNNWCPHCDYTPSGGAIAWNAWGGSDNGTPTEIATFATTHALADDAQTLANDGMHGKYVGRCLLFYNASTLSDIDAYLSVMQANCY